MAINNLLLGQKYGFQVGSFHWLIGIITTHAARRRLRGRWLTSSFTRDQSPGLGMNQRRTHRQVDMQPLSNFYRTRVRSLVTHLLTHCQLVDLIDMTLAIEDANSKLVEAVTVTDAEKTCWQQFVADLVIKLNFCSDFEHKVWPIFNFLNS